MYWLGGNLSWRSVIPQISTTLWKEEHHEDMEEVFKAQKAPIVIGGRSYTRAYDYRQGFFSKLLFVDNKNLNHSGLDFFEQQGNALKLYFLCAGAHAGKILKRSGTKLDIQFDKGEIEGIRDERALRYAQDKVRPIHWGTNDIRVELPRGYKKSEISLNPSDENPGYWILKAKR